MENLQITPTNASHVEGISNILDSIELFPSQMLGDMIEPYLNEQSEAFWLTALSNGKPLGFTFTVPEEAANGSWNMLAIGVHSDSHGIGIGTRLIRATEDALISRQGRVLVVDTSGTEAFKNTRRFYMNLGYTEAGTIPDFWDPGDAKVTFFKLLK